MSNHAFPMRQSIHAVILNRALKRIRVCSVGSQELHFEHLVVRNSSGYAFGPSGRAQLRLEGEEVMASKDGVVYQPFKACAFGHGLSYFSRRHNITILNEFIQLKSLKLTQVR